MTTNYRRIEPLDAIVVDGEALLLLEPDQVVRLSPIATAVFELTATEVSGDQLLASLQEQFGSPPDGDAAETLRTIVEDLVRVGVLSGAGA